MILKKKKSHTLLKQKLILVMQGHDFMAQASFGSCKSISEKYSIFRKCYFQERKMYSSCLAALEFVLRKNQFRCLVRTNILRKMSSVLRKINSHVWFSQTFYGKWNSFFTENQFSYLVCGSFYGKYEMPYNFKHLHYLNKPVIV